MGAHPRGATPATKGEVPAIGTGIGKSESVLEPLIGRGARIAVS
jgi:hypothetical protein